MKIRTFKDIVRAVRRNLKIQAKNEDLSSLKSKINSIYLNMTKERKPDSGRNK